MIKKFNNYINEKNELEGKRIELIHMNDKHDPVEPGTKGTIKKVDDLGQIHVDWDNGRTLAIIPEEDEYKILNEDTSTTATVGSGTAVGGGATGSFTSSAGQAVYGGDSGTAFATNSNTSGMGAVKSAQPSDVPCDVAGSIPGSGDVSKPLGTYTKNAPRKKKKKNDKRKRRNNKTGANIDKFYTSKYTEKYEGSKIITNWKTFNEEKVNENIFGDIARFRLGDRPETKNKIAGRRDDDNYVVDVYNDMVQDFNDNDKDLRKAKLIEGHTLIYVFGKYDKIKNSPSSGNTPYNKKQKKIEVIYNSPNIKLKRNELEKTFGISRGLEFGKGRIKITEIVPNPNHNPNFQPDYKSLMNGLSASEKEMYRTIDRHEESFKISYDLAKSFIDFFLKEYDKQYPELKKGKYKNDDTIRELEKGNNPTLGYVNARDKNNKEFVYPYYDLKDKKKIENYIRNHEVVEGRNKDGYYITYFLDDTENMEDILNSMGEMDKKKIDKQNLERAKNYN